LDHVLLGPVEEVPQNTPRLIRRGDREA
jgi:hypothetical protein